MRCDKSGGVFFRPSRAIFHAKNKPGCPRFCARFSPETATRAQREPEERSGGERASAARGQRVDWEKNEEQS